MLCPIPVPISEQNNMFKSIESYSRFYFFRCSENMLFEMVIHRTGTGHPSGTPKFTTGF